MSQEAFKLVGIVEARTREAETNLRRVDRVAQTTAKSMGSSLGSTERGFLSAGRAASSFLERFAHISNIIQGIPQIGQLAGALTRPLFQAAEEGIRLNMTLEQAQIGFEQVAGSAERADRHLKSLQKFGQQSPFRFEGLLQASRLMTTFGFDLDEQIPKLRIWGNAIASSGELSADKIHDVVTAFGQMRSAGRVNGQDMMQLTNANIPGWELLAKAIGKTVAETRKLSEQGRLNGPQAVEAITAMMAQDKRFAGMMARLEKTTAGRLSAGEDILQFAQASATKSLTGDISKTLEAALKKQGLVESLAGSIDSAITPVSGAIRASASALLGGGLTGGISEGIAAGRQMVMDQVGNLGQGVIDTFAGMLGINSPSKVFMAFGHDAADGFNIGFAEGLNSGALDGIIEQFLGRIEGKLSSSKKRSAENLARLMQREPGFKDKLISGSRARGINPDDLLNVMAVETAGSFNPAAKNPNSTASGLIQFMAETAKALGTTTAELRKMSATNQLDYVFKYFDKFFAGRDLSTQGALYAAVGAGKVGSSDNSIVMTSRSRGYAGNAATWDPNGDGLVRQGEMGAAAQNKLGAGVNFSINGSPVTAANPVPVAVVAGINLTGNATPKLTKQDAENFAKFFGNWVPPGGGGPKVGGETSVGLGEGRNLAANYTDAQLQKIDAFVKKVRTGNKEISTDLGTMANSTMPKTAQAFEQMADSTEQAFKAAGQYAKDVIQENEEAVRRMSFDWNAIGAGFESAFANILPDIFEVGGKKAGLYFLKSFARSIGDEGSRQLSAIFSKVLFNFDGGNSESDGGIFGGIARKISSKLGIGKKSGSVPASASKEVGAETSAGLAGVAVKNASDKIADSQRAAAAEINAQSQANTDRIVDAVTPRQEGFWKGLLRTTLSAAAGAAAGTATGGLFGGGSSQKPDEGPRQPKPKTPPVMKFPNGRTTSTPGHAFGGIINGPGTDTSDSILGLDRFGMPTARVSRGEFVVNAEATRKHRAALELINSGRLPKFGLGGFLKWTSPILANESVRNATMPIMNSGFRNATMPIMNGGFRNATMPAIGYLGGNNGPQLNGPANAGATNAPPAETHKHYHFNVHAHGSDAAQSIQKSRRQLARQARETLSSAA